jgi:hypothetical protein
VRRALEANAAKAAAAAASRVGEMDDGNGDGNNNATGDNAALTVVSPTALGTLSYRAQVGYIMQVTYSILPYTYSLSSFRSYPVVSRSGGFHYAGRGTYFIFLRTFLPCRTALR